MTEEIKGAQALDQEREIEDGPVGVAELGEVPPEDLADVAHHEATAPDPEGA